MLKPLSQVISRAEGQLRRARIDLETDLRNGKDIRSESLFLTYPALAEDTEAALELVYTEFVVRDELGQSPKLEDWYTRFPKWRNDLEQMFEVHREIHREVAIRKSQNGKPSLPRLQASEIAAERIADFELQCEVGRGGMGVVYKARQISLNRTIALKVILSGAYAGEREKIRFQREVESAARLDHPNIVRIYEVGSHDSRPYCAMEFVDGGTLADKLKGTPWPARQAAEFIATLSAAVQHAHERGIIHRDLKPANILLQISGGVWTTTHNTSSWQSGQHRTPTPDFPFPKIADFGLAKYLSDSEAGIAGPTRSGDLVGTPAYMSPEQVHSKGVSIGPGVDIWALGITFYEMLTGHLPFHGESTSETLDQVRTKDPLSPRQHRPNLPRDLQTICMKCLAKNPAGRYATAAELSDDLGRWLRGEPILARPVGMVGRLRRWCVRNPRVAGLISIVLSLLIGGSALFAFLWWDATQARNSEFNASKGKDAALIEKESAIKDKDAVIESLEHQKYGYLLGSVSAEIEGGAPDNAREILKATPAAYRNTEWEFWNQLSSFRILRMDQSERASRVFVHPDGKRYVKIEVGENQPIRPHVLNEPDSLSIQNGKSKLKSTSRAVRKIQLVNWETNQVLMEGQIEANDINHVSFSNHGNHLVIMAKEPTMTVWDLQTGRTILEKSITYDGPHSRFIIPPSYDADSPRYFAAFIKNDTAVQFWDFEKGNLLPVFQLPEGQVISSFIPSPDQKSFCINARNAQTKEIFRYHRAVGDTSPLKSVSTDQGILVYNDTGKWALTKGNTNETLGLLNVSTGKLITTLRADARPLYELVISRDGQYAAARIAGGAVQLWHLAEFAEGGRILNYIRPLRSFNLLGLSESVAFSDSNQLIVTSREGRAVSIFDNPGAGCVDRTPVDFPYITNMPGALLPVIWYHPDGRHVFSAGTTGFDIWDATTQKTIYSNREPKQIVIGSTASNDGKQYLVARTDIAKRDGTDYRKGTTFERWDFDNNMRAWQIHLPQEAVLIMRFNNDGTEWTTIDRSGLVEIRDSKTGALRSEYTYECDKNTSPVISPDLQTLYWLKHDPIAKTMKVTATETATGKVKRESMIFNVETFANDCRFLSTNRLLVTSRFGDFHILDLDEAKVIHKVPGTRNHLFAAVSPDGKRVYTIGRPNLTIWDAETWQKLTSCPGDPPFWPPRGLTINQTGTSISAIGERGHVRTWQMNISKPEFRQHGE